MNKRIEDIAAEAGFSKDKYDLYWDDDSNKGGVDLEKFAELIIRECVSVVKDYSNDSIFWDGVEDVLEHFGVKE